MDFIIRFRVSWIIMIKQGMIQCVATLLLSNCRGVHSTFPLISHSLLLASKHEDGNGLIRNIRL